MLVSQRQDGKSKFSSLEMLHEEKSYLARHVFCFISFSPTNTKTITAILGAVCSASLINQKAELITVVHTDVFASDNESAAHSCVHNMPTCAASCCFVCCHPTVHTPDGCDRSSSSDAGMFPVNRTVVRLSHVSTSCRFIASLKQC